MFSKLPLESVPETPAPEAVAEEAGAGPVGGLACVGEGSAGQGGVRDLHGGALRARVAEPVRRRRAACCAGSGPHPVFSAGCFWPIVL